MRVQQDGVIAFLSGNLYPLLFVDEASVVCSIILDVQYVYIYIYMRFLHPQGFSSILRQHVHCPLLSPDVSTFTRLWFWTLSFDPEHR